MAWIDSNNTIPKKGIQVLFFVNFGRMSSGEYRIGFFDENDNLWYDQQGESWNDKYVIFWRPLPKQPKIK